MDTNHRDKQEVPDAQKAPPGWALGEGISPEAPKVSISAEGGSHVWAPIVSHCIAQGGIHIHHHGAGESATAKPTQEADLSSMIPKLRRWICSQYKTVEEYNSLPGQDVLMIDRYTDLLIVQQHRKQEKKEEELSFCGSVFFSAIATETYQSTTVDQFFSPDGSGDVPRTVMLQGHSGHGKSFTVQKIMLDWASGNLYQDQFELILHLRCKELNQVSKEKSLVDLASYCKTFTLMVSQILKDSPQKVLFVIDGFDELRFTMDEIDDSSVTDLLTPAPVEAILKALLKGSILEDCFLLVTTRSTASDKLSKLLKRPLRFTEILGFSEKGVQEYFQRFCQDQQVAEKAFSSVKANETLFTSCSVPVICWIVCTVFKEQLKENDEMTNGLETTTSIFVHFVSTLLEHHCNIKRSEDTLTQSVPTLLRSLSQLAKSGMPRPQQSGMKVFFDKNTVLSMFGKESKISDLSSVPFLCKFLMKKSTTKKEMFTFMHVIFQEFFTALNYNRPDQNQEEVKDLLNSIKGQNDAYVLPVIQFLFGLSNTKVMEKLEELELPCTPSIRGQLKQWILEVIENSKTSKKSDTLRFILHCLYELHDKEFVGRVMEVWGKITFDSTPLTRQDCWVLLYCLQCCPTTRSLQITQCYITADKLKMLKPGFSRCEELGLYIQEMSDDYIGDLISALGEGKMLNSLHVNGSLLEENVQQIFSVLSNQKVVGTVWLSVDTTISFITAQSVLHFYRRHMKGFVWLTLPNCTNEGESYCATFTLANRKEDVFLQIAILGEEHLGLYIFSPTEIKDIMLKEILHRLNLLRCFRDKNGDYDEHVNAPFTPLSSLPGPTSVHLKVTCLTKSLATRILSLVLACPSLSVNCHRMDQPGFPTRALALGDEGDESCESLCTILSMGREEGDFCLMIESRGLQLLLQLISSISDIRLREILSRFHQLRRDIQTNKSVNYDEYVGALCSSLASVPDLKTVRLHVSCLTESWAIGVFSLIQTCTNLKEVRMYLSDGGDRAGSLCSVLMMGKEETYIRLMMVTSVDSFPQPESSEIRLKLHFSLMISDEMLREVLRRIQQLSCWTERSLEYNEHVDALLSCLASLPDLSHVNLGMSCLTEIWATVILTLIQICPSLKEVWLDTFVGEEIGLLLEEGIHLLLEAQRRPDCTINLMGKRCCKANEPCTEFKDRNLSCNQLQKITLGKEKEEGEE